MAISLLNKHSLEAHASLVERSEHPELSLEVPVSATTTYLTHGLFRYAGKVPPPLVAYLLDRYSSPGDKVVDPMCGGGTTAIEAVSSKREALSYDVNPVARLVTEGVSTTTNIEALLAFAEQLVASPEPLAPPDPLTDYFSPEAYGLLRRGLDDAASAAQKALVLSVARPASFANTKKINTVVDPEKQPKDPAKLLMDAARRFADGFDELQETEPARSQVIDSTALSLPLEDASADFVLLHPPYLTNTAFSESMHLQLLLLGSQPKSIRKSELAYRGSYFHVPNGLHKYLLGWARILTEAKRILRSNGHLAVIVGDGRIDKVRIPVGTITAEFGLDLGLELVERAMHRLNNQTGWTLSRRMTGQHILVFRKP